MVIRQRHLVRHIQFIAELSEYSCRGCERTLSWGESREQSVIGDRIWKLFSILGAWKPAAGGMTLELNVHSPSDTKHWFQNWCFVSDNESPDDPTPMHDGHGEVCCKPHDPKHGWVNGQRVKAPPENVIAGIFLSMVDTGRQIEFPRVEAVTCFMIRRELRRYLRPLDMQYILGSFPRLKRMVYEPWRPKLDSSPISVDCDFTRLLENSVPKTLRRLALFEDFNVELADILVTPYRRLYRSEATTQILSYRDTTFFVSRIFNLNLEELAISYMVHAEHFFPASITFNWWDPFPIGPWERLQTLALTSQLLQPTINDIETNDLLCRVGVSALQMPKLHTLAIWTGIRGIAAAFIYRVYRNHAAITWRGTWNHELSAQVIEAWQSVATTLHSVRLGIEKQMIHDVIESHGDAIYYLDLPCRVIEPASLWQIRKEHAQRMS